MTDSRPRPREQPGLPTTALWLVGGLVAGALVFYGWLARFGDEAKWGPRGDAIAPFVALLNAGALFGALWSIKLQRRELSYQRTELQLQRREMRAQRHEMRRQREEAEKSVKAQTDLVEAQRQLAKTQRETALATLGANYSAAMVALVQLRARVAEVANTQGTAGTVFEQDCQPHLESLDQLAKDAYTEYVKATVRLDE